MTLRSLYGNSNVFHFKRRQIASQTEIPFETFSLLLVITSTTRPNLYEAGARGSVVG
jgi:hypothetical protein